MKFPMQSKSVKILDTEILSDNWYTLRKVTYQYLDKDGNEQKVSREAYDRGNGATVLLYNTALQTVILTRQFRLPTFINGNESGMLIECCAGLLDDNHPEDCIRKEIEEETGYSVSQVQKIFEAYMSPGSVTEVLHFFIAKYTSSMQVSNGGGLIEEDENIEVMELDMKEAYKMIGTGQIKDAKTIILLQYMMLNLLSE
jgi:GDP-mannose pyrophosphatase NudK